MTSDQGRADAAWYVARAGAQLGPFTQAEIARQIHAGEMGAHDLVWCAGWPEWRAAAEVFKLAAPVPPPVPVSPAPPLVASGAPRAAPAAQAHVAETRSAETPAPTKTAAPVVATQSGAAPAPRRKWAAMAAVGLAIAAGAWWWAISPGGGGGFVPGGVQSGDSELGKLISAAAPVLLLAHPDTVSDADISSDRNRIVTASKDKLARLWDAKTGAMLASLSGHSGWVTCAAFNPDSNRIVTSSEDKTARLWDAKTAAHLVTMAGHSDWVKGCGFSKDGRFVVTTSSDNTARVWDAQTGAGIATLSHPTFVESADYSPDGSRIATSSGDNKARIWDATTHQIVTTLEGHSDVVESVVFSPDGSRVVTTSRDKTARLWDAKTGATLETLSGHTGWIMRAAYSPDGKHIVTASHDGTLRLWDAEALPTSFISVGPRSGNETATFSADGTRVLAASSDKTARIWDVTPEGLQRLAAVQAKAKEVRPAALAAFDCDTVKKADGILGDGDNATQCAFDRLLKKASGNEMFVAAVKYEDANDRAKARQLYNAIGERFAADPVAIEATKRLAALKDKEDAEKLKAEAMAREQAEAEQRRQADAAAQAKSQACAHVYPGKRIPQAAFWGLGLVEWEVVGVNSDQETLTIQDTSRGSGGFGSKEISCSEARYLLEKEGKW